MRYPKKNGYLNKYGLSRYEQKQINKINKREKLKNKTKKSSSIKKKVRSKSTDSSLYFMLLRFLGIFLIFLFLFNYFRSSFSVNGISFSSFFNWLSTVDSMPIKITIKEFGITADWGIFNGLRNFLNLFAQLFGVIVFLASNIINLFIFLSDFLRFLFVRV